MQYLMKLKDFVEKPGFCTRVHITTHVETQ